jgi:hypothetical protein
VHRDNTFGTPEEDAFRRDFTINALFYDIGTFSIIDYTGGLQDLRDRVVRCIGDPTERFQEDPVRMLRAVAMAARLDFHIDPPIEHAISAHRHDLTRSAPARLMEELYKLLRSGAAETAFRMLADHRLLEPIAPELQAKASQGLWKSLSALDAYRAPLRGDSRHADQRRPPRVTPRPGGLQRTRPHPADAAGWRHATRAAAGDRHAAAGATRRRAAAADSVAATEARRHESLAPRPTRAHASRAVSGGVDLARYPRRCAGTGRTLARIHRGPPAPSTPRNRRQGRRRHDDDGDAAGAVSAAARTDHGVTRSSVRTPS